VDAGLLTARRFGFTISTHQKKNNPEGLVLLGTRRQ